MIGQRSEELKVRPQIHDTGCYFLCICYLGWQHSEPKKSLTSTDIVYLYDCAIHEKTMEKDCYVLDPQKIMDEITTPEVKLKFKGKYPADYKLKKNEKAIELWNYAPENWWHFVIGNYDPWKESITRKKGTLDSYRVWEIVE